MSTTFASFIRNLIRPSLETIYAHDINVLRADLYRNLFQDVWYCSFPDIPAGATRKTVHLSGAEYRISTSSIGDNHKIMISVHRSGQFIGTLSMAGDYLLDAVITVPHDCAKPRESARDLMRSLELLRQHDCATREEPALAVAA